MGLLTAKSLKKLNFQNPRWLTVDILKTVKSPRIIKTKMAEAAILKITKIAISPQQFDRSLRNLASLCKMVLLTVLTVKKLEFPKSKMADGRHLKTVKSSYLSNRWTDFDEIWHGDANLPGT